MSDYVLDYVWAFALALIITFALTPLVKRFAVAVGAIDKPDARKVHHGAIPRLGGLAIFLGYVGSVLFNGSIRMIINYLALYLVLLFWCL